LWTDEVLTTHIRHVLATSPFLGEGHRKVWARLRAQGIRTSKPRVLRLMRQADLLAPSRVPRVVGPRVHDGTITTERPNQMWGTDATSTVTVADGAVTVFIGVDHCTLEGIGIHAAKRATRFEALEPIRQGVRQQFGAVSAGIAAGLQVRHDHGSQYMSDDFQAELRFLGITSSPAFVRAPEGNGVAERFIRTLKEQLLWVRTFQTVEELRQALLHWLPLYNEQWLVERHGFRSPRQVRRDLLVTSEAA
jgi:transposase InsO family protein